MSGFTSGRWAASGWAMSVAAMLLVLGGCSGDAPTDPELARSSGLALASEAVPFHDHGVDFSFSGVIPCADFGIPIEAEFDYDITADVTFFPEREIFRIHTRRVVLTHTNLETGATVVARGAGNETYDLTGGRDLGTALSLVITGATHYRGPNGGVLIQQAGRLVFGQSGLVFEAGQHPAFEPDFITFICTALS
jgi:hypothetical protein